MLGEEIMINSTLISAKGNTTNFPLTFMIITALCDNYVII